MDSAEKWSAYRDIPPEGWDPASPPGAAGPVWALRANWLAALFNGEYHALLTNADPQQGPGGIILFVHIQGRYEARIHSRLRPGETYDFNWQFDPLATMLGPPAPDCGSLANRAISVARQRDGAATGTANVVWLVDPKTISSQVAPAQMNLRIFAPDIDETIDFNLATLAVHHQASGAELQQRAIPWRRLLDWMVRLREIDRAAFGRVPAPLKSLVTAPDARERIARLPLDAFTAWSRQGALPPDVALLTPPDVPALLESVRLQQRLAGQQDFLMLYQGHNPIPPLIQRVNADTLDPVDLQVFMTIGALREMHGFLEIEMARLIQRRPDLQAALQSPQGPAAIGFDSEVVALKTHPQAIAEQQDMGDIMLRKAGNFGPTARDMMRAMQQQTAMMQAQTMGMMNPLFGAVAAWDAERKAKVAASGPPWKLYTPFLC